MCRSRLRPLAAVLTMAMSVGWASAAVAANDTFTTLAGIASIGSSDGAGSAARFNGPGAVAVDAAGNVYVADSNNHTIRKITPAGVVSTLAGQAGTCGAVDGIGSAARFCIPLGIAVDGGGTVYVADAGSDTIRKITPGGLVATLAGLPFAFGSADGTGSDARFGSPSGVAVDGAGNVYVADRSNSTIRKITAAGVVSTLAGLAGSCGAADGTGAAARFCIPFGVAVDGAGTVYVADSGNFMIRKVTADGTVSTLAGSPSCGSDDGPGATAKFCFPSGVVVDGGGTIYVADTSGQTIRTVTPLGQVGTLAGRTRIFGGADGTGSDALFNSPTGVAVNGAGTLYVADSSNNAIRAIAGAEVTTLAGVLAAGSTDGLGNAVRFNIPLGIAVNGAGIVYVADTANSTLRQISPAGLVTTLAGRANSCGHVDGAREAARFCTPAAVAVDRTGMIYVVDSNADVIRTITPAGVVGTLAGLPFSTGSADGVGIEARFFGPQGIAVDRIGNVYVADTFNRTIRKITPGGLVSTLAGTAGSIGTADGVGGAAQFTFPIGLAVDQAGKVYVTDDGTIRTITPDGVVSTLSGQHGACGQLDGDVAVARFCGPTGIAVDSSGTLYVSDTSAHTIRMISPPVFVPRGGNLPAFVNTLAGLAFAPGNADGSGNAARFRSPQGIAVTPAGTLFVADSGNNIIRRGGRLGNRVAGDFDGDRTSDITVYRRSTGTWFVLQSATGTPSEVAWGSSADLPVPGDYDGDGKIDMAVYRPATGAWFILQSGTGSIAQATFGSSLDAPVPGDYDGDGRTDIAVYRRSTGAWFVVQSRTSTPLAVSWGVSNDVAVPGDYDGDGKTDVAVYRPSTGTWYVFQSGTSTPAATVWGTNTDVPVAADFDGDGRTDIAVYRPSTGTWYVIQSSTSTPFAVAWGSSGDIPVPGDYDGDGKADLAVYRPSTGTWFIVRSSTGTGIAVNWGTSTDTPVSQR